MISLVTWVIVGLGALTIVVAGIYARTDRLIDDRVLALVALLEAAVLVQVVRGLSDLGHVADDTEREALLPPLTIGAAVAVASLTANGHATSPPARYTEASLVKRLEGFAGI